MKGLPSLSSDILNFPLKSLLSIVSPLHSVDLVVANRCPPTLIIIGIPSSSSLESVIVLVDSSPIPSICHNIHLTYYDANKNQAQICS